jgi:hypothetical protein
VEEEEVEVIEELVEVEVDDEEGEVWEPLEEGVDVDKGEVDEEVVLVFVELTLEDWLDERLDERYCCWEYWWLRSKVYWGIVGIKTGDGRKTRGEGYPDEE